VHRFLTDLIGFWSWKTPSPTLGKRSNPFIAGLRAIETRFTWRQSPTRSSRQRRWPARSAPTPEIPVASTRCRARVEAMGEVLAMLLTDRQLKLQQSHRLGCTDRGGDRPSSLRVNSPRRSLNCSRANCDMRSGSHNLIRHNETLVGRTGLEPVTPCVSSTEVAVSHASHSS